MIEWKSWKDDDLFDVMFPWEELRGNLWVNCHTYGFNLDEAKQKAQEDFDKRVRSCIKLATC